MIELVRAGRNPEELAAEFEPPAQTIRNWVAQADADDGKPRRRPDERRARGAGAVCAGRTASCGSSARSWQKPRPGSLGRPTDARQVFEFVSGEPGRVSGASDVSSVSASPPAATTRG